MRSAIIVLVLFDEPFPVLCTSFLRVFPVLFFSPTTCKALNILHDLGAGGYHRDEVLLGLVLKEEARRPRCRGRPDLPGRHDRLSQGEVLVVFRESQPLSSLEALGSRRPHPRMVDLLHRPPRNPPPVGRADLLRVVLHRHHRLPVHPHLSRLAPH